LYGNYRKESWQSWMKLWKKIFTCHYKPVIYNDKAGEGKGIQLSEASFQPEMIKFKAKRVCNCNDDVLIY